MLAVVAALAAAVFPSAALGFGVLGASGETTQNAYGLWFAGQQKCAGARCHTDLVNTPTVHSEMVTDISAHPEKLSPSIWPAPNPWNPAFGSFQLQASDIYLQVGKVGTIKEYVGFSGSPKATTVVPGGDAILWDGVETGPTDEWEATATAITPKAYSQSCGGCHNLGVTRPSKSTFLLPNGGTQTSATPAAVVGLSIQCEVCHGTGKNPGAHNPGIPGVVGGYQILKSQVCGQCHVSATAPQLNVAGSAFGNANGYTTDQTLSAYLTPYTSIPTTATFLDYVNNKVGSKPKFLPNGANYSMNHVYYNEWLVNLVPSQYGGNHGHADPVNEAVKTYNSAFNGKCVGCHSGLGFLNRIGAVNQMGSKIVTDTPSMALIESSDPAIACAVCHTGHVTYAGADNKWDMFRKWGDGKSVSCPDCHNWQYEQLEQPVQRELLGSKSYARPAANQRVVHASRELVSGGKGGDLGTGGLWGVAPMGEFMTDVKCENCHMPKTYSTRVSHRFHVVKPGDAQTWKMAVGQDSCSQADCHKGSAAEYTRTDFQQWIDSIQSGTVRTSDDTTRTLGAASASLGMGGTWADFFSAQPATSTATATEWKMLQKSAQNADFVINDGSKGVHQPQYSAAGLKVALMWARSFDASLTATKSARIDGGDGAKISGTLLGNDAAPLVGATVVLEASNDGGATWTTAQTKRMSSTSFSFLTGAVLGETLFRCSYTPDAGVVYRTDSMAVSVPFTTIGLLPSAATTGWVDSAVHVTLSPSGPDAITMYSLSGATGQPTTMYTGPFTITANGKTDITYWSTNAEGSEVARVQEIRIDRTSPVMTADASTLYLNEATVHLTAADSLSGPKYLEYALDGAALAHVDGSTVAVHTEKRGMHTLRARATNNLGHTGAERVWVFYVKSPTTVSSSPSLSSASIKRNKTWTYATTVRTSGGAAVAGKTVLLQRSTNGSNWSTVATRTTSSRGTASRAAKMTSKGTTYWRWYVPSDNSYLTAIGPRIKLVVK
jgi:mono/diheme cytochrome c family protein